MDRWARLLNTTRLQHPTAQRRVQPQAAKSSPWNTKYESPNTNRPQVTTQRHWCTKLRHTLHQVIPAKPRRPEVLYAAPSYTPYCCLLHRNRNKQVLRSSVLLHHSCSILQHRAQLLHNNLVTPAFYTEAPKYYSPPSYYTEAYTSYAKPDNYTNAPQNYATAFYYTTKARSTTVLRRPSTTPLPMLLQRTTLKFQSTIDGPKDFNWWIEKPLLNFNFM